MPFVGPVRRESAARRERGGDALEQNGCNGDPDKVGERRSPVS